MAKAQYVRLLGKVRPRKEARRALTAWSILRCWCCFIAQKVRSLTWLEEIACLSASVIVTITLAVVLRVYDGLPVNDWTLPINLNSIVALLITILYMFLMAPISATVSQLKWNRFHAPHSLHDFYTIDQASRSIAGSIRFLIRRPQGFTTMAALMTIIVNAIGPLAQQIVYVDTQNVPGPVNASLPMSHLTFAWPETPLDLAHEQQSPLGSLAAFDATERALLTHFNGTIDLIYEKVVDMSAPQDVLDTVYNGIYSSKDSHRAAVSFFCPSVNCTWADTPTLKFKAECVDLSNSVQANDNIGAELELLVVQNLNVSVGSPNDLPDSLRSRMASVPAVSLPNGFNISLLEIYMRASELYPNNAPAGFPIPPIGDPHFQDMANYMQVIPLHHAAMSSHRSPINLSGNSGTVLNVQALYFETGSPDYSRDLAVGRPRSMECSVDLVVQTLTANVTSGNFSETDVGHPLQGDVQGSSSYSSRSLAARMSDPFTPSNELTGTVVGVGGGKSEFLKVFQGPVGNAGSEDLSIQETRFSSLSGDWAVDPIGTIGLAMSLASIFEGNLTSFGWANNTDIAIGPSQYLTGQKSANQSSSQQAGTILTAYANLQRNDTVDDDSVLTLPEIIDNLASSLTLFLRQASNTPIDGNAYVAQAVYRVNIVWLSIPVLFTVLTLALTVAVAVDTKRVRVPVWKDSAIATMAHGLVGVEHEMLLEKLNTVDLHRMAKQITVELSGRQMALERASTSKNKAGPG